MTHKLFYTPGACSMAPHIALEEIGSTCGILPVLVPRGDNATEAYRAIHPRGFVPALEIDGGILTEAVAILLHLARRHPQSELLPAAGSVDEARTFEWLAFLTNTVHVAYAGLWRPERFTDDEAARERIIGEATCRIAALNGSIERKLADGRSHASGENYSLADPFLLVFYRWANRIGLDAPASYPAWTDWARRIERRPAVQRVLDREGTSLWR